MEAVYNSEVLLTKLQPPNLPEDFVSRKKLSEYASENIERPLTLISAGAGFGKSTFAGYWLKNVRQLSCWLSIDESDNDLRTFLIHFVAAINTVVPEFGKKTQNLLHLSDIPGAGILKKSLINELDELPERVILAIDDFHYINNKNIIDLFSELLKYPPKNLHLVIITRSGPPLPLARLRAHNKMKDIRSVHLKLNKTDIKQFARIIS